MTGPARSRYVLLDRHVAQPRSESMHAAVEHPWFLAATFVAREGGDEIILPLRLPVSAPVRAKRRIQRRARCG